MKNILFVTAEVYPFIKTGGLADVSYALPKELINEGQNVKIMVKLVAYGLMVTGVKKVKGMYGRRINCMH